MQREKLLTLFCRKTSFALKKTDAAVDDDKTSVIPRKKQKHFATAFLFFREITE